MPTPVTRLYERISPKTYILEMDVDLSELVYSADESITFDLNDATTTLVFHADGPVVTHARLEDGSDASSIKYDSELQTISLVYTDQIPAGEHTLQLSFTGIIDDKLHGFYASKYQHQGIERTLVVTQFEAIHAREAIICIDEPEAKAVFEISITADASLTVLSNTNVIREITHSNDRVRHDFAPTPLMSTYLVAWTLGEFSSVRAQTPSGVMVAAYATPGRSGDLAFALDTAVRTLTFYDDYFDTPYPLPKLDMIAIPDFAAGAMENWGLVTYRETALLLNESTASLASRRRVAEVVAHELAHQWFGNLVTMQWWNDLWLNEGFASWVEVLAQDELFPEWGVWTQFGIEHTTRALELDSLINTHPIDVRVDDPKSLDEIFDAVSYSKGASIIHMLSKHLGSEVFRNGLRIYLKRHEYGNAQTNDLWIALSEAAGLDVAKLMKPWTDQPGFPIVSITQVNNTLRISQERFLAFGPDNTSEATPWPIPLHLRAIDGESSSVIVDQGNQSLPHTTTLTKINADQAGFYRVRYDHERLSAVLPFMQSQTLPVIDRYGVVSDLYATTAAGYTDATTALDATHALRGERSYVVWESLAAGFASIIDLTDLNDTRTRLQSYGRWLIKPNLDRLGISRKENESYFDQLMRPLVLAQAVSFDDRLIMSQLAGLDHPDNNSAVDPDLRGIVYSAKAKLGGIDEYHSLLKRYRIEQDPQERMRLLGALCRFTDKDVIRLSLDLTFSADVRAQDAIFIIAWSLHNIHARDLAWDYIQENWSIFTEKFSGGGHMLSAIANFLGGAYSTVEKADEIDAFFKLNPHPALTRPAAQAVEQISAKAAWAKRDMNKISVFLDKNLTS